MAILLTGLCDAGGSDRLEMVGHPRFWSADTEYISGAAAAPSIALKNAIANVAGLGLPTVVGRIKAPTQNHKFTLLKVAAVGFAGGLLELYLYRPMRKKSLEILVHEVRH